MLLFVSILFYLFLILANERVAIDFRGDGKSPEWIPDGIF